MFSCRALVVNSERYSNFQTADGQSTAVRKTVGLNQGRYPRSVLDSRFGWIVFVWEGSMAFAGRCETGGAPR